MRLTLSLHPDAHPDTHPDSNVEDLAERRAKPRGPLMPRTQTPEQHEAALRYKRQWHARRAQALASGYTAPAPESASGITATRVAELEAELAAKTAEVESLLARIENDRERSRRNHQHRQQRRGNGRPRQLPLVTGRAAGESPAAAGTPPIRDNLPPRAFNYAPVADTPAAAVGGGTGAAAAAAAPPDEIWQDAEVLAAARRRGLEPSIERLKLEDYLPDHPTEAYTRRRVLRWLETAWPAAAIATSSPPTSAPVFSGGRRGDRDRDDGPGKAWIDDAMADVEHMQAEMRAGRIKPPESFAAWKAQGLASLQGV